jgi:SpoVK/Ycf46/Vps4 family AAA+-type ATPase
MLNKTKEHNLNKNTPTRINNYNHFLLTLDNKKNTNIKNENNETNNLNLKNENNESNKKKELIEFIQKINNKILNEYLDIPKIRHENIKIINPDNYIENTCCQKKCDGIKRISEKEKELEKELEKNLEPTNFINIDMEVNNINDLLLLIEKYQIIPDTKYNINIKALHNIKEPLTELNNMIGMQDLKNNIVDQILYFIQELYKSKNNDGDFLHTVIYGPPGTGKTEIAKIIGKIYSKIGILNKGTFKKVTRSDLVSGYLGQTALKTKDVIKEALGGVLFIDEAYSLGNTEKKDSFSKECIDTLCESLSDNKNNLMVIIAGYEHELKECFFNYNQGLESRFTWRFNINEYKADDLYKIFVKKVNDIEWTISENSGINVDWFKKNIDYFKFFGRDIETLLAKTKVVHSKRVFCKSENEKKKITLADLNKGFELYIKNENVKNRKENNYFQKSIYI